MAHCCIIWTCFSFAVFVYIVCVESCDGVDRSGSNLDVEANRITGVDVGKIEDCRRFNARTKHIDKSQNDEREYQEGLAKIGEKIIYLRQAACNCILDRLKDI